MTARFRVTGPSSKSTVIATLLLSFVLLSGCSRGPSQKVLDGAGAANQSVKHQDQVGERSSTAREKRTPVKVIIPAGTALDIRFVGSLSSETSHEGDTFKARVARPLIVDGRVVIAEGSTILGRITQAVPVRKIGGQARLVLAFDQLELPSGQQIPIAAHLEEKARNETKRDAATIAGSTVGGAILGHILEKRDKGTALGALVGAAAGTAIAAATKGQPAKIGAGATARLRLEQPVTLELSTRSASGR